MKSLFILALTVSSLSYGQSLQLKVLDQAMLSGLDSLKERHQAKCLDKEDVGTRFDDRNEAKQYFCNEYPFGKTTLGLSPEDQFQESNPTKRQELLRLWNNEKHVVDIPFTYKGKTMKFVLHAQRQVRKQTQTIKLQGESDGSLILNSIYPNVFYRIASQDFAAKSQTVNVCSIFSGLDFIGKDFSETFTEKKLFFTAKATIKVNPGKLNIGYFRLCADLKFYPESLSPISLIKVYEPELMNVTRSGLTVKVDGNWLYDLFEVYNDISGNESLTKKISEIIKSQDRKLVNDVIKNGKYLESFSKSATEYMTTRIQTMINDANSDFKADLASHITSTCLATIPFAGVRCTQFATQVTTNSQAKFSLSLKDLDRSRLIEKTMWRAVSKTNSNQNVSLEVKLLNGTQLIKSYFGI